MLRREGKPDGGGSGAGRQAQCAGGTAKFERKGGFGSVGWGSVGFSSVRFRRARAGGARRRGQDLGGIERDEAAVARGCVEGLAQHAGELPEADGAEPGEREGGREGGIT